MNQEKDETMKFYGHGSIDSPRELAAALTEAQELRDNALSRAKHAEAELEQHRAMGTSVINELSSILGKRQDESVIDAARRVVGEQRDVT